MTSGERKTGRWGEALSTEKRGMNLKKEKKKEKTRAKPGFATIM